MSDLDPCDEKKNSPSTSSGGDPAVGALLGLVVLGVLGSLLCRALGDDQPRRYYRPPLPPSPPTIQVITVDDLVPHEGKTMPISHSSTTHAEGGSPEEPWWIVRLDLRIVLAIAGVLLTNVVSFTIGTWWSADSTSPPPKSVSATKE